MYARYQIGVILLTVLVGCVILFMLFFVMRNMQKLSRVTRQFARGQYDARVKIKSEDEIGRLAEDFNWMADAMSRQMEQLQYEVRRQEEFTAAFAHELKTPLTSIIGYADTIRQMELSKEETDMCADYIFRQGKRLQTLAYKLLEMTMVDKQEITLQAISVPEFLREIQKTAAESLKEKQLTLLEEADPGLIYGDRDLPHRCF
ncbi:MAG: histidine kinase dimerization/phospho-acceptor domain-containing protein [Lachnospiraceae bacterium]